MVRIEEVLQVAMDSRASDIHLTAGLPPKMRVNGHLLNMDFPVLKPEDTLDIVGQIMTEHQKMMFEERGELDMSFAVTNLGRYRVNAFRQRGSVAMALRAVNTVIPTPAQLGVPNAVVDLYNRKRGLVLVTGPTGSGKTTTLASMVNHINKTTSRHIMTIEDPIEYVYPHNKAMIHQREVGKDVPSFASALRSALREDPDIILVGEMRDYETISAAIAAAETGHLVLSTLHTTSAAQTVERIIDATPLDGQDQIRSQFSNVIRGVITQTLLPSAEGDGRVVATEIMVANVAIGNLIRENKAIQIPSLIQAGRTAGMHTLNDDLASLIRRGRVTKEEAMKVSNDPSSLEKVF